MYINSTTNDIYQAHHEIRSAFPNTSFPTVLTDEILADFSVFPLQGSPPTFDIITQTILEQTPVTVDGVWTRQWSVDALPQEQAEANLAAKLVADAATVQDRIEALWAAADRYVTGYISGVAIGILTIGVIQGKPKALAVTAWSNDIWSDYYARKEVITAADTPSLDFSMHGPMPHTVPELQVEIGL